MEGMMNNLIDFKFKQRKYIPVIPKANGKPTIYIEGYPCEDDEPMAATGFHGVQINTFYDQLSRYFAINDHIYIGVDSFIYYREGDITKSIAPDVYVVFGVAKGPERRSFYTWSEGAVPVAVFEFLSDSTVNQDRNKKVGLYLNDIGVQEYFIHQPEMKKPAEFLGWRGSPSGNIVEMVPDATGGIFSKVLNLWFRWKEDQSTQVRLLRPYLPDGTPITTSMEEKQLREQEQQLREQEQHRRLEAEARAEEAERVVRKEAEQRQILEAEVERLRAQLANRQGENA